MNHNEFKHALIACQRKTQKQGLIIAAIFGVLLIFFSIYGRIVTEIPFGIGLGGLSFFTLLGLVLYLQAYAQIRLIENDSHPVLVAIQEQSDYLVWVYQDLDKAKNEKVKNVNRVSMINQQGNRLCFSLTSQKEAERAVDYLSSVFPKARIGYTETIQSELRRRQGQKAWA